MSFLDKEEQKELDENLKNVKNKILVLSGKGGVGKSSVAANLGQFLASQGYKVGIMDVDFHGPNMPKMLGVEDAKVSGGDNGKMDPVYVTENLKVVSIAFFLETKDDPVIWRGPKKIGAIKQFLKDVNWGELDYLIIDSPPGTGDEPLTIAQFAGKGASAVVVTTPQNVAILDVRKSLSFCKMLNLKMHGVVLNMSYFLCDGCGKKHLLFHEGNLDSMLADYNVSLLGEIPFDPEVSRTGDNGHSFQHNYGLKEAGKAFEIIGRKIIEQTQV